MIHAPSTSLYEGHIIGGNVLARILDFSNKYIKTMVLIIFFAMTVFAAGYLIKTLGVVFSKFFIWFLPFILAMLLSYILEPLIKRLEPRLNRKISSLLFLLLLNVVIIGLVAIGIALLSSEIVELQHKVSFFSAYFQDKYNFLHKGANRVLQHLPAPAAVIVRNNMEKFLQQLPVLLSKSVYLIKVVPITFKTLLVWFISCFISYLILRDREKINLFFKNTVSNSWQDDLKIINTQIFKAVMGFIKSQLILVMTLFLVSLIGLIVVGSDYFVIISVLAGIFSIIPVIGTGVAYIPFILIKFSVGDTNLAVKLIVVYVITIVIREIVVVKVVSDSVGLDLLSTIISMYVGIEMFGGFGFILGPLLLIVIKVILKSSMMDKFRKKFNII